MEDVVVRAPRVYLWLAWATLAVSIATATWLVATSLVATPRPHGPVVSRAVPMVSVALPPRSVVAPPRPPSVPADVRVAPTPRRDAESPVAIRTASSSRVEPPTANPVASAPPSSPFARPTTRPALDRSSVAANAAVAASVPVGVRRIVAAAPRDPPVVEAPRPAESVAAPPASVAEPRASPTVSRDDAVDALRDVRPR